MRWDGLFDDLEAQAEALAVAERAGEIEDRARSEFGRVTVADRLRMSAGSDVRISCRGGLAVQGTVARVQQEWLLLEQPHAREVLVSTEQVLSVTGLGRLSAPPESQSPLDLRLGLRLVLRQIARDRSNVRIHLVEGALDGTIDRVGADFLDVAVHLPGEPRRRSAVLEVCLVPLKSVVALSRAAGG